MAFPSAAPNKKIMDTLSIVRIACALICSSLALPAQTLQLSFVNLTPAETLRGSFDGVTFNNKDAGVLNFTGGAVGFCVEPLEPVFGTATYNIQPNTSLTNSASIAKVMGAYLASSKTSREAASAQWAIWEIVSDGISSPSFTTGRVQIFFDRRGGSVQAIGTRNRALEYLSLSQQPTTPSASFIYATNVGTPTGRQDVVLMIPEPSSVLLGALSITALLIRRRR